MGKKKNVFSIGDLAKRGRKGTNAPNRRLGKCGKGGGGGRGYDDIGVRGDGSYEDRVLGFCTKGWGGGQRARGGRKNLIKKH